MLLSLLLLLVKKFQQNIVYFIVQALGFSQFYYYYQYQFGIDLRMIGFSLSTLRRAVLRHPPTHSESAYVAPYIIADLVFLSFLNVNPSSKSQKQDNDSDNDQYIIIFRLFVCPSPLIFCPPPTYTHTNTHLGGGVVLTSYFITTIVNHPVFCVLHF